jgi:metal-responsive CopG/Arc/MetJ family transcriptional regulator
MKTVSFSLDEETVEGIEALAKRSKVSRSDIVRSLYARMRLEKSLEELQTKATPLLQKLGLYTEDDIAAYAKSKA